ncbi:hypothetical protein U8C45_22475 [Sinorhizobium meliloti]|nr:hypothetical protein U8C39_22510 [Sinorhizobium meliloti]WQP35187.1 hypothetical protein U8C45_22475 [Sinorhizobium meliloti]
MRETSLGKGHHVDFTLADNQLLAGAYAVGVEENRLRVLLLPEKLVRRPIFDVAQFAVPFVRECDAVLFLVGLGEPSPCFVDTEGLNGFLSEATLEKPSKHRIGLFFPRRPSGLAVDPPLNGGSEPLPAGTARKLAVVALPDGAFVLIDCHRQAWVVFLATAARAVRASRLVAADPVVTQANAILGKC